MQEVFSQANQVQLSAQQARKDEERRKERPYKADIHRGRFLRRTTMCAREILLKEENDTHPDQQEANGSDGEKEGLQLM